MSPALSLSSRKSSPDLPWLGLALLLILAIAFLLPILPNDFWWYLRLGEDILNNGNLPTIETYSLPAAGQPANNPAWLSAVLFALAYRAGGPTAIVLLRGLTVGGLATMLWFLCRQNGARPWLASLLTLLAALAGANNWAIRPQLFAYPLFGLTLWLLVQHQNRPTRNIFWLIGLAWLWANLHSSFLLLFVLGGLALLTSDKTQRRTLFLALLIAALAACLNPRGPLLWVEAIRFPNLSANLFSQEWAPPTNQGWQMNLFFAWLLLLAPLASFSSRRLNLTQWAWLLALGWLALSGTRYVVWCLVILALVSARLLSAWLPEDSPAVIAPRLRRLNLAFLLFFTLLPVGLLPGLRQNWWKESPPTFSSNTPIAATAWLEQHPELPGPLWNEYVFGSYLIYAAPDRPVWIDTRFHLYSTEHWQNYLAISNATPGWQEKLQATGARIVLLDPHTQPLLDQALSESTNWCKAYQDENAVIYLPSGSPPCVGK